MESALDKLEWRNFANLSAFVLNFAVTFASLVPAFPGETNSALSAKYQTLITPSGATFSIWGPIFIGEAVFSLAQMLPRYRSSKVVQAVTPGWLLACGAQVCWTLCFSQEAMLAAVFCMLVILAGLLWVAASTDGMAMTWEEFGMLRWSFSLHLGWIMCASVLNVNTLADFEGASPQILLGLAIASLCMLCISGTVFALVKCSPEPIVNLTAVWALAGIFRELSDPELLNSSSRHNPYTWSAETLEGLQIAVLIVALLSLALAAAAATRVLCRARQPTGGSQEAPAHEA